MIDQTIRNELVKMGLTDKEAVVYLALLERGDSTVEEVSQASEINRSSVYPILDSLCDKKLVINSSKNPSRYEASSPELLFEKVSSLRETQLNTQEIMKNLLP